MSTKQPITFSLFLEVVELRTKVASVFPLVIGLLWFAYRYDQLNWLNTLLFSGAVLAFDMATTAINNAMDYQKALDKAYQDQDNVIGRYQLDLAQVVRLIMVLLAFATFLSLILVWRTDFLLLPMGVVCFLIGIFYTFGPLPLSRLPLGEVFSGLTMGFGIFFLANYVQAPQRFISSQFLAGQLILRVQVWDLLQLGLMSLPLVALIANIMLANNLCDYKQDINNDRFTLVHYLGVPFGIRLYQVLSLLPWLALVGDALLGWLPVRWLSVVFLPLSWYHFQSVRRFSAKQVKRETFIESIKSFVWFSLGLVLVLGVALL